MIAEQLHRQGEAVAPYILAFILIFVGFNPASAATALVIDVFDGDTLSVEFQGEKVNIKLYGIDAPESGQDGNITSTRFLHHLVRNNALDVKVMGTDVFGRTLAILSRKGQKLSINASIVANGYAWVKDGDCLEAVCKDLKKLESQARQLKLGIWSGIDLIPPWEFSSHQQR